VSEEPVQGPTTAPQHVRSRGCSGSGYAEDGGSHRKGSEAASRRLRQLTRPHRSVEAFQAYDKAAPKAVEAISIAMQGIQEGGVQFFEL